MRPPAHPVTRGSPASAPRLRVALAGSALAHLLAASALDARYVSSPPVPRGSMPLDARIEIAPVPAPPAVEAAVSAAPVVARRVSTATRKGDAARGPDAAATGRREAFALPAQADPTVYSARDLDSLPRPVGPLPLAQLAGAAAGEPAVRLELTVDEHGAVREVTFIAPRAPGTVESELRNAFTTAAFVPARKDGRAVKSRITLSVTVGGAAPEQRY